VPGCRRRGGRAPAGRPGDGPPLARGRLRAADPRRLEARPEAARLERGVGGRGAGAARARGDLRRRLVGARRARGAARGRRAAGRLDDRRRARRRRMEVPLGAVLARGGQRGVDGGDALVVIPDAIRAELCAHAAEEAPNECCGVLVFRDGTAERYVRGENRLASPYRSELEIDPSVWFLEDEGYELAVFHSHPETEPIPSRTDRELAGLWSGRPFLIYGLKLDELRAWRIARDGVEELPLS